MREGSFFLDALLWPLAMFVAGLLFDLLQYLYKGLAWGIYYKWHHGKGTKDETVISPPRFFNSPTWLFFALKFLLCFWGFYFVLKHICFAINQANGS